MDATVRSARVGIVMPALDEEEALPLVLAELPRGLADRVVVVDNGSRDRTAEVARAAGVELVQEPERGYGRACLAGLAALWATGPRGEAALADGDVVAFLDADHADHAEDLAHVVAPVLASEADLVIGSRTAGRPERGALTPQQIVGNRLACLLMRWFFGARYTDLGPMRAIRVGALRQLAMGDPTFGWTIEMQLKAHSHGLRVLERPVRYRARRGKSKISGTVRGTLGAARKILGWILVYRLTAGRRRPAVPAGNPTCR